MTWYRIEVFDGVWQFDVSGTYTETRLLVVIRMIPMAIPLVTPDVLRFEESNQKSRLFGYTLVFSRSSEVGPRVSIQSNL